MHELAQLGSCLSDMHCNELVIYWKGRIEIKNLPRRYEVVQIQQEVERRQLYHSDYRQQHFGSATDLLGERFGSNY